MAAAFSAADACQKSKGEEKRQETWNCSVFFVCSHLLCSFVLCWNDFAYEIQLFVVILLRQSRHKNFASYKKGKQYATTRSTRHIVKYSP